MNWWGIALLCWGSFLVGFFFCAILTTGRSRKDED